MLFWADQCGGTVLGRWNPPSPRAPVFDKWTDREMPIATSPITVESFDFWPLPKPSSPLNNDFSRYLTYSSWSPLLSASIVGWLVFFNLCAEPWGWLPLSPFQNFRGQSTRTFLILEVQIIPESQCLLCLCMLTNVMLEGDRVVVHGKTPSLTKPLRRGQKTDVRRGVLEHDSIIGQRVRDLVKAHKGRSFYSWPQGI